MKLLIVAVCMISFVSCCTSRVVNEPHLQYSIKFGSGGGFTGSYEGYYIDSTGVIQKWNGRTFETAKFQTAGKLSSDQIDELNKLFTDQEIMKLDYRHPGNMTQFIILEKNSSENKISWEGTYPGSDVPESARKLYMKLNEMLKNSQ